MQSNRSCQFRCNIQNFLIPTFAHAAGIYEDECCSAILYYWNYFMNQFNPKMSCPGIFFNFIRENRFDLNTLFQFRFNNNWWIFYFIKDRGYQYFLRLFEV